MQEIPIYIISLDSANDRRSQIEKQFANQELSYSFFSAINGRNGHQLFDKYNERKTYSCKGYKMNPGQLGCYASHYLLWEKCVRDDTPIIIFEDDVIINFDILKSFINQTDTLAKHCECIRLFKNMRKTYKERLHMDFNDFSIYKYNKGHMSTMGFYLTPTGARKFLVASSEWFLPVDLYMDRFWANKVKCFGIKPACIEHDFSFESNISTNQTRLKYKKSYGMKLRKELFNFSELIKRKIAR